MKQQTTFYEKLTWEVVFLYKNISINKYTTILIFDITHPET